MGGFLEDLAQTKAMVIGCPPPWVPTSAGTGRDNSKEDNSPTSGSLQSSPGAKTQTIVQKW